MVSDVATSVSCRDINSWPYSFELVSSYVATSVSCLDINLRNCNLQLSTSLVATSVLCHDINLYLWRLQLVAFGVATSVLCRDITLSYINFIISQLSLLRRASRVAICIKFPSIFLISRLHNWTVQTPKLHH